MNPTSATHARHTRPVDGCHQCEHSLAAMGAVLAAEIEDFLKGL